MIDDLTFYGCTSLRYIKNDANLEKIGHCAFAGAPLETFYIQKNG